MLAQLWHALSLNNSEMFQRALSIFRRVPLLRCVDADDGGHTGFKLGGTPTKYLHAKHVSWQEMIPPRTASPVLVGPKCCGIGR